MKKLAYCALALFLPFAAQAKSTQCYSTAELEAEMLVRLHSELMVVTLSCKTSSTGQPLPPAYEKFTQNHLSQIKASEKALMAWYRKNVKGDAQGKFDRMRTELANDYSKQIANMSPVAFCAKYRDYAATAGQWGAKEVGGEVQNLAQSFSGHAPLCQQVAQKTEK